MEILQQADILMAQAEEYAKSALQHLPQSDPRSSEPDRANDRNIMEVQLKIRFLFPQLSNMQVQWLSVLYWVRQSLTRLVNTPQRDIPPILRSQTEGATRQIEQCFMTLVAQIRGQTFSVAISPVQVAILDGEFFHIPFLEPP